jgi:hypothetical protein
MRQRKPNRKLVVAPLRLRSPVTMPHPSAATARHGRSPISRRMQNGRSESGLLEEGTRSGIRHRSGEAHGLAAGTVGLVATQVC